MYTKEKRHIPEIDGDENLSRCSKCKQLKVDGATDEKGNFTCFDCLPDLPGDTMVWT
jgi:hypothetical protein